MKIKETPNELYVRAIDGFLLSTPLTLLLGVEILIIFLQNQSLELVVYTIPLLLFIISAAGLIVGKVRTINLSRTGASSIVFRSLFKRTFVTFNASAVDYIFFDQHDIALPASPDYVPLPSNSVRVYMQLHDGRQIELNQSYTGIGSDGPNLIAQLINRMTNSTPKHVTARIASFLNVPIQLAIDGQAQAPATYPEQNRLNTEQTSPLPTGPRFMMHVKDVYVLNNRPNEFVLVGNVQSGLIKPGDNIAINNSPAKVTGVENFTGSSVSLSVTTTLPKDMLKGATITNV